MARFMVLYLFKVFLKSILKLLGGLNTAHNQAAILVVLLRSSRRDHRKVKMHLEVKFLTFSYFWTRGTLMGQLKDTLSELPRSTKRPNINRIVKKKLRIFLQNCSFFYSQIQWSCQISQYSLQKRCFYLTCLLFFTPLEHLMCFSFLFQKLPYFSQQR